MGLQVARSGDGHILTGAADAIGELVNGFLAHLTTRNYSPATRRAYAFDLLNFLRFLRERRIGLADVAPTDLFDYLDWQQQPQKNSGGTVVRLTSRTGAAPATMNRRIAAVRSLYDYAVIAGAVNENPVPAARRSSGFRAMRRGLLGHLGKGRERSGGKLVREAKRLPFALDPAQVAVFISDLLTARDRSIALLMLLGGLRASEVRLLPLADVDFGLRRVRVTGKGGKERVVPVDPSFFTELASYLRTERPVGCSAVECFVVLRGPTTGHALTEAGLRRIFRTHRLRAGTPLVRPHRLRHTYGTELAAAGIDLLVLRDLMGHARPGNDRRLCPSVGNNLGRGVRGRQITIGVMMSTATKPLLSPAPGGTDLYDYFLFVAELSCGPQAKYLRRRHAAAFLDSCTDPVEWMRRPVSERLLQINRLDAWAFLSWCFATNRLVPDLELLTLKGKGTHFSLWTSLHPDDDTAVRRAAAAFDWSAEWEQRVTGNAFPLLCMTRAVDLKSMTDADLDAVEQAIATSTLLAPRTRRVLGGQHRCLRKLCYQLGATDIPPVHPNRRERTPAQRADGVPQPLIRPVIARYLTTIAATLRPATVASRAEHLTLLAVWLSGKHPGCRQLTDLTRAHLEEFLAWDATRLSQGRRARGERISVTHHMHAVINLRSFFDDLTAWGWADRPAETVVHRADIPRPPAPLPRALAPQTDSALMKAVANLPDTPARAGITLLRGGGLRLGELLDLELDCLWDLPGHGTWLKVPLGKLNTERVVPLDDATLTALDQWMSERGSQRALPHPRTGRPADFLFTLRGTRIGASRIRRGLDDAARAAGLIRSDGTPEHVTPHQLRHTYATELVNAGMTLQALMALLGHVTPEMTTRYAHLADTTVRASYDSAMARIRETRQLPLVVSDRPIVPERIEWLHSEMLKTRVAHGYCSRHLAAEACPYANICEQCDNYTTSTEFLPQLESQIHDETELRDDALERGWDSEVARHARVISSLQKHLNRLKA